MKVLAGIVMCLCLCLTGTAEAEKLLCVTTEGCAALLTADGREVVSPGVYDDIFPVAENRYALGVRSEEGVLYALCDDEGKLLTEPLYSMVQASGGAILFRQGELYGAMDPDGIERIAPQYTQLTAGERGFLAMTGNPFDEEPDAVLRIAEDGTAFDTAVYTDEGLERLSDGLMPYQDPANELYGYLNEAGTAVIPARFETAEGFRNGLARASENGSLGVIGTDGEWRIAPEYDYIEMGSGVIVARNKERVVVFDGFCRETFRVEGAQPEAALAGDNPVLIGGDVLYVYNADGERLLEAGRSAAVSEGLDGQLIVSDGYWGSECVQLVNADGTAVDGAWQHLLPLNAGRYAFVKMNAAAYYSDALDEIRYSVDMDSLRCGMMDATGSEILPAEYLEIRAVGEERYLTVAQDGLRIVDGDGNAVWSHLKEE